MTVISISCEFFPTKTEAGATKLLACARELATLKPDFFSCTYGAGGSTRERTLNTVLNLQQNSGITTAPHLSCVGESAAQLLNLIQTYQKHDIKRIVALRGDLPSGMGASDGELRFAYELIEFIRIQTGDNFHITVAAYPEIHPQALNGTRDIQYFVNKVKAGANSAITQYFFNADSYFYFVDEVQKMGVDIPIIAGIMPITNYAKLARFSDTCGAEIPRWLRKKLESYADDNASIVAFGEEFISKMCEKLIQGGAHALHFYTLNQANPTLKIGRNLGLIG